MKSPTDRKVGNRARKKYSKPVLHSYGAVRSLTKNFGMTGTIDGGGKNPKTAA